MHHTHHLVFIGLSVGIAVFGAWTALDLFRRAWRHDGLVQTRWVVVAALAMGVSIWSMHFIAMLGFDPGGPVSYDVLLTAGSLLLAIVGTAGAFSLAARWRARGALLLGGAVMGASIGGMHYLGMAAMRTQVEVGYRPEWVVASLIVAFCASTGALAAARRDSRPRWRILAAGVLGLGVVAMHYTAMQAVVLSTSETTTELVSGSGMLTAPPAFLAAGIAVLTLLLLVLGLGASVLDQRQTLLSAIDAGRLGYWEMDIAKRRLTLSSLGRSLLGLPLDVPFDQSQVPDLLMPESAAERGRLLEDAIAQGRDFQADYELRDGRWLEVRGRMIKDQAGRPQRLVGIIQDVTEHRAAYSALARSEARQNILINELNHRVKNTLATVLSISHLTARRSSDLATFSAAFQARLMALSATHNLLTAQGWEQAEIRNILDSEARPFASEQVRFDGPAVWLGSEQVLALALILHEMMTNAAKYGALSTASGLLSVSWRAEGDDVVLDWVESGGPPVVAPRQRGFGTRLIEMSAQGALGGSADLHYPPEGFNAVLKIKVRTQPEAETPTSAAL